MHLANGKFNGCILMDGSSIGKHHKEILLNFEGMEPLDKTDMNNALSKRLATVGEGFYHVCLEVDDVEGSGKELEAKGMKVLMREPTTPGASVSSPGSSDASSPNAAASSPAG